MDYELAKKLKEARFDQENTGQYNSTEFSDGTYVPTLSELIRACGDKWESLSVDGIRNKYISFSKKVEELESQGGYFGRGETPEEAVANLWLKLNEQRTT